MIEYVRNLPGPLVMLTDLGLFERVNYTFLYFENDDKRCAYPEWLFHWWLQYKRSDGHLPWKPRWWSAESSFIPWSLALPSHSSPTYLPIEIWVLILNLFHEIFLPHLIKSCSEYMFYYSLLWSKKALLRGQQKIYSYCHPLYCCCDEHAVIQRCIGPVEGLFAQ
jgi:hypothetical protein